MQHESSKLVDVRLHVNQESYHPYRKPNKETNSINVNCPRDTTN